MDPIGPDPETDLTGLEKTLARLRPSTITLDRDRLLFEAGRAAGRADWRGRIAPLMVAGLGMIAVGLGSLLARERAARADLEVKFATLAPRPDREPRPTFASSGPAPTALLAPEECSYIILSRHVLAGGLDAIPMERSDLPGKFEAGHPAPAGEPLRVRSTERLLEL